MIVTSGGDTIGCILVLQKTSLGLMKTQTCDWSSIVSITNPIRMEASMEEEENHEFCVMSRM